MFDSEVITLLFQNENHSSSTWKIAKAVLISIGFPSFLMIDVFLFDLTLFLLIHVIGFFLVDCFYRFIFTWFDFIAFEPGDWI